MAAFLPRHEPRKSIAEILAETTGKSLGESLQMRSKSQALSPLFEQLGLTENEINQLMGGGLAPQELLETAKVIGSRKAQKKEDLASQKETQDAFNRLWELSSQIGFSPLPPGASFNAEKRAEFESLKGSLVGALREMVNRGALTNQKFKYITEQLLPSHGDREATKKGKMKGIARVLGLEIEDTPEKEAVAEESFVTFEKNGKLYKIPQSKALEAQRNGGRLVR